MIPEPRAGVRICRGRSRPRNPAPARSARTGENARVTPSRRVIARRVGAVALGIGLAPAAAAPTLAHGREVPPPPDAASLLLGWSFQPQVVVPLVVAAVAYLWAVRRVDAAHPANPVPRDRPVFWLIGLGCLAVALLSGIERYDTELFSVHMIQHALIVFGAGPALVLAAPITLLLRAASPGARDRWILPVLRSRVVKTLAHPVVAWILFTAVTWGSHLSPLFDAALEDPVLHYLEHVLYLSTAMLFWWPVVARDPSPWRLPYPARAGYVFLQMPLMALLSVLILFSPQVIYPHYMTTGRTWLPTPLQDQQLAGALMWGIGDLAFLVALFIVIAAWMRHDEAATRRREAVDDARVARLLAASDDAETATASRPGPPTGAPTGASTGAPTSAAGGQAEGIGAAR